MTLERDASGSTLGRHAVELKRYSRNRIASRPRLASEHQTGHSRVNRLAIPFMRDFLSLIHSKFHRLSSPNTAEAAAAFSAFALAPDSKADEGVMGYYSYFPFRSPTYSCIFLFQIPTVRICTCRVSSVSMFVPSVVLVLSSSRE